MSEGIPVTNGEVPETPGIGTAPGEFYRRPPTIYAEQWNGDPDITTRLATQYPGLRFSIDDTNRLLVVFGSREHHPGTLLDAIPLGHWFTIQADPVHTKVWTPEAFAREYQRA